MSDAVCQRTLTAQGLCFSARTNSALNDLSVNADAMAAAEPITLFDRLMAVKPPGMSANAWATRAGVSRNVFNDIRRRGAANHATIEKLLTAITLTWSEFEAGVPQPMREPPPKEVVAPRMAFQGIDRPRDVPVLGTAECGEVEVEHDSAIVHVESMELHIDDVVDHVRRPVSLDNRRDAYAIYFHGSSMAPRYESGELAYVDPKRPPSRLDYVVVQLRRPEGEDGERIYRVLAKRLVRKTASFYELEQFNPPMIFRVPVADVAHCHRIFDWAELVAF